MFTQPKVFVYDHAKALGELEKSSIHNHQLRFLIRELSEPNKNIEYLDVFSSNTSNFVSACYLSQRYGMFQTELREKYQTIVECHKCERTSCSCQKLKIGSNMLSTSFTH